jgi:hypothetical protein
MSQALSLSSKCISFATNLSSLYLNQCVSFMHTYFTQAYKNNNKDSRSTTYSTVVGPTGTVALVEMSEVISIFRSTLLLP